jgi:NADH pyrophosphatase NudC (nudix superfamily)
MYVFVIYASKDEIKFSDELSDIEWFNINQIWKVPLAPVDVTVAQILLEFNED